MRYLKTFENVRDINISENDNYKLKSTFFYFIKKLEIYFITYVSTKIYDKPWNALQIKLKKDENNFITNPFLIEFQILKDKYINSIDYKIKFKNIEKNMILFEFFKKILSKYLIENDNLYIKGEDFDNVENLLFKTSKDDFNMFIDANKYNL